MTETITIDSRFRGPPDSGNGGYCCGRLATFVDGPARVRLHVPPPVDTPLSVEREPGRVTLSCRDTLIATAWPAELTLEVPPAPEAGAAAAASERFRGHESHFYPSCFVCGTGRKAGDGLNVFAGPLQGSDRVAAPVTLDAEFADDDGRIAAEFVWAVLDCPGAYSFAPPETGSVLLGELTVRIDTRPAPDEPLVVIGWELGQSGRKHVTGTALYRDDELLAVARATWFEVP